MIFIGLVFMIIINSGCPKPCVEANYTFAVNTRIYPDLDSIRVNDTVYISSTFPTRLSNQTNGSIIDYSNANDIESTISIAQLITGDSIPKGAVVDFNYISELGMIYNSTSIPSPELVQQLRYVQVGNNYQLMVGLIPKRKGVFALGIGNGLSNSRSSSSSCEKANFLFTISSTSQHIYYYQKWRPGFELTAAGISKLYCFKVY